MSNRLILDTLNGVDRNGLLAKALSVKVHGIAHRFALMQNPAVAVRG